MAKGAVDLDDRVMVFSLFPTCVFLCVMVKEINFKFQTKTMKPQRLKRPNDKTMETFKTKLQVDFASLKDLRGKVRALQLNVAYFAGLQIAQQP